MEFHLLNILLVEDDEILSEDLSNPLKASGHNVTHRPDGDSGFEAFCNGRHDFCIFDLMLPGIDGFTLTERVRNRDNRIPIIIISRRNHKDDKKKAFDLGVDNYLVKPFDADELIWHIRAIARRTHFQHNLPAKEETQTKLGCFIFDAHNQILKNNSSVHRLTRRECEILGMLCRRKNQIVKREEILMQLWGDVDYFHGRSLDVFMSKLRRYLKSDESLKIENIPTVGYVLRDEKQ